MVLDRQFFERGRQQTDQLLILQLFKLAVLDFQNDSLERLGAILLEFLDGFEYGALFFFAFFLFN